MGSVTVNGSKVNFDAAEGFAEGNRKGNTVLLIHGATDNHKIWHHQMEALSKDHSPVSVDLPGHLDSGGEGIDNAEGYRAFVKGLAEALNLAPFVFAGHSDGRLHGTGLRRASRGDAKRCDHGGVEPELGDRRRRN